ncbi:MAG TPA: type II secretion system protein [Gaiellaceae bacterium]|nr:type II secretion system protein [Gaiellaceae bacterium]
MRKLAGEGGLTIVEAIVVMVILGTVLAGITTVFVNGSRAELQNNNRFRAQETARVAMDQLRLDAHNACAANTANTGGKLIFAFVPLGDSTRCGSTGSNASYPKVIWCALTSPTLSTAYALYRSTATDSTCTSANGTLEADRVTVNTNLFALATCTGGTVCPEQYEAITVNIPVSFKTSTFGAPYALSQTLALRNAVYQTTSAATACPTTASNSTCVTGTCPASGPSCYPPVIQ